MRLRPKFSIKFLLLFTTVFSVLVVGWILPSRQQKHFFESKMNDEYGSLESISELALWKRILAYGFGPHSVCNVVEISIEPESGFDLEDVRRFNDVKELNIGGGPPVKRGCAAIFQFRQLEILNFEQSGELGDVSGFANLENLTHLALYQSRFSCGGEFLGELPKLKTLLIRDSPIDQLQIDGITQSKSVDNLWLSLDGENLDLTSLASMKQVTRLGITRHDGWTDLSSVLELQNLLEFNVDRTYEADLPVFLELRSRGIRGWYLDRLQEIEKLKRTKPAG